MVRIPAEYQEVEYLESTGSQYINTGIIPTLKTKAHVIFSPTWKSSVGYFGARHDPYRFSCTTFSSQAYLGLNVSKNTWTSNRVPLILNVIYDCELENGCSKINGTEYTETALDDSEWSADIGNFILSGLNASGNRDNTNAKWYLCEMWENNILIRYLIPCYRKSDSEPGMYDTVSKTFYTNSGSGTFLVGNDVSWDTASLLSRRRQILLNTPHIETTSGAMASFNTDISANLKECKVYFSPVQEGTGDPSPDNVRPITGWDGVTVSHSISDDIYVYNVTSVGNTYLTKINNNSFRLYTKAKVEYPSSKQLSTSLGFVSGKKYRIEFDISVATLSEGHHINFGFRNNGNTFQTGYLVRCDTDGHYAFEFTFTNTTNLNYLSLCQVVSGTGYFDATISNLKIYEIESLTIPFPQTIYGGYVDLVKGEVVEEWVKTAFNVGRWVSANGVISCFAREVSGRKTQVSGADVESKIICNIYKTHRVMPIS